MPKMSHLNRVRQPREKLLAVFYLLCIGFLAALAAGAFSLNDAVLGALAVALIGILSFNFIARRIRSQK